MGHLFYGGLYPLVTKPVFCIRHAMPMLHTTRVFLHTAFRLWFWCWLRRQAITISIVNAARYWSIEVIPIQNVTDKVHVLPYVDLGAVFSCRSAYRKRSSSHINYSTHDVNAFKLYAWYTLHHWLHVVCTRAALWSRRGMSYVICAMRTLAPGKDTRCICWTCEKEQMQSLESIPWRTLLREWDSCTQTRCPDTFHAS